jgi:hypothetical protein
MSYISAVGIPEGDNILAIDILENGIPAHSNPIDGFQTADVCLEFHLAVARPAKQHKLMPSPK